MCIHTYIHTYSQFYILAMVVPAKRSLFPRLLSSEHHQLDSSSPTYIQYVHRTRKIVSIYVYTMYVCMYVCMYVYKRYTSTHPLAAGQIHQMQLRANHLIAAESPFYDDHTYIHTYTEKLSYSDSTYIQRGIITCYINMQSTQ